MFRLALAILCVCAIAGAIGLAAELFGADALDPRGSGTLVADDVTYEFAPTTCFISADEFVAAGTGQIDGDRFWVSASSENLDLSVGTESALDQPADDQLWLISTGTVDWTAAGDTVVARADMADRRLAESEAVLGELQLRCDPAELS
ncbi:MAG: hypothetical protein AAGD35_09855 [Actinomycetota bacterium]